MHHAKNRENKEIPLAINTLKDTTTIMRNPSLHIFRQRVMHDCGSILDSIAKGISPCFHNFSDGASHPYIPIFHLHYIVL